MKNIWKYELQLGCISLKLPVGGVILTAGAQNDSLFLWIEVDSEQEEIESRTFEVFGTGQKIVESPGERLDYISTVFMGRHVWHAYERVPAAKPGEEA